MFMEEIIGAFTGQNRRTRHRQVALGTALGLLVGGVTALLLAPQSGAETREDIQHAALLGKEKAVELGKRGLEQAKELASKAGETFTALRGEVEESAEEVGEALDRAGKKAARHARRTARRVRKAAHRGAQDLADALEVDEDEDDSEIEVEVTEEKPEA